MIRETGAESCVADDAEPLCHAGIFLLLAARNSSANRSVIGFGAWSSLAHAAVMASWPHPAGPKRQREHSPIPRIIDTHGLPPP